MDEASIHQIVKQILNPSTGASQEIKAKDSEAKLATLAKAIQVAEMMQSQDLDFEMAWKLYQENRSDGI